MATLDYQKLRQNRMRQTTRQGLQEQQNAPLVLPSSGESFNPMSLKTDSNVNSPVDGSMPLFHSGSGYNLNESSASMSGRIFVLSYNGKPLTPCKPGKARKLLSGGVAKVVWNKFGQFGIQMIVQTREFTPKTVLGIDNGTKFEGYSLISGNENILNVMWLLPDKNVIRNKLEERRRLRRAKRWRNCRRRECRFNNRGKDGFIAPSQLVLVNSRLKVIKELFKCYPINKVAIEDVNFNHRDNKWGKNFSTVEIGKKMIKDYLSAQAGRENIIFFSGYETGEIRDKYGLKKSSDKSAEIFNSHCVDSFALCAEIAGNIQSNKNMLVADDTYRPARRRLHDTKFKKGGIREKYSTGNFKGVRKGTICDFGQIVGGTKNNFWIRNPKNKRVGRTNISWLSHNFKVKEVGLSGQNDFKKI